MTKMRGNKTIIIHRNQEVAWNPWISDEETKKLKKNLP